VLFRSVGDLFTASSSGLNRFVITQNGNVGIGTTTPNGFIEIKGNQSDVKLNDTGASGKIFDIVSSGGTLFFKNATDNAGDWIFRTSNNTNVVDITGSGYLGIGNNSELGLLDVRGNNQTNAGTLPIATLSGTTSFAGLVVDNSGVGDLFTASSSGLNRFVITQAGNVGVGTTTPNADLASISNTSGLDIAPRNNQKAVIGLVSTGGAGDEIAFGNGGSFGAAGPAASIGWNLSEANALSIYTNGAEGNGGTFRMGISNGGLVGINANMSGSTLPLAVLDVRGVGTATLNGTIPVASISGATSFAGLVVDNSGVGDLFTASSSGKTLFTVNNSGTINTASVGTAALKTATGSTTCGSGVGCNINMNDYSFSPSVTDVSITNAHCMSAQANVSDPGNTTARLRLSSVNCSGVATDNTATVRWRYVTASDHPTIWTVVNADGTITSAVWEAEDPISQLDYPKNPNPLEGTDIKSGQYFLSPQPLTVNELKNLYAKFPTSDIQTVLTNLGSYIVDQRHWVSSFNSLNDINNISDRYQPAAREWALRYLASHYQQSPAMAIMLFLKVENGVLVAVDSPYEALQAYNNHLAAMRTKEQAIPMTTKNADLAEWYKQTNNDLQAGDVVAVDTNGGLIKTIKPYDTKLMGVISTSPNQVIGVNQDGDVALALTGRVPVKVSTANGPIAVGDLLTSSSLAGVAMKATKTGATLGKALEAFDGSSCSVSVNPCVGTIMTFISLSSSLGSKSAIESLLTQQQKDQDFFTTDQGNADALSLMSQNSNLFSAGQGTTSLFGDTIFAGTIVANKIKANQIEGLSVFTNQIGELSGSLATLATKIENVPTTDTSTTATIAQLANNLSDIPQQVASLSAQMNKLDDLSIRLSLLEKLLPSVSASTSGLLNNTDATISGKLSVLGKTLLSDVGITGKLNMGLLTIDGIGDDHTATPAASLNTLSGPLKLQSPSLGGIDILNGKVTIDTSGNLTVNGKITAKTIRADEADLGKVNIKEDNTASASVGEATIPAGQTSVVVKTAAVTDTSHIFTSPDEALDFSIGIIDKKPGQSFTAAIPKPVDKDIKFSWWIVN